MSFELDVQSFQRRCWGELYSKLLVDFFKEFRYEGKEVIIEFPYKSMKCSSPTDKDYNEAILNKRNFCRPLRVTARLISKSTGERIDSESLGPIMVPELTERGFIIGGHPYDVANQFREAFGWYITVDKESNIIISMKTKTGGKFVISRKGDELILEHNSKKIGFGIFLKAITELDSSGLIEAIGTTNPLILNTLRNQLTVKGRELSVNDCIARSVEFLSKGRKALDELRKINPEEVRRYFETALEAIDMGNEGFERYKKFISYQRRAEGSVLLDEQALTDGTVIPEGANLSRADLIKLDNCEDITSIVVEYQSNVYTIRKFPLDDGKFNQNMMMNIASIAFTVFSGLGVLDDRDSLENRVVENVARYIVSCIRDYLMFVCRNIDSYRNRSITNIATLATQLSALENPDYIVQRYKKETFVQLKDDVNIISEITKSYKLSYKKSSAKARVGDAIRNIKVKQYMRVCPVDTPESKEVGLNTYLTATAGVDENGFITAKYYNIKTGEYEALNALEEMGQPIMVWNEDIENNEFVRAHIDGEFTEVHRSAITYMDVSPTGLLSFSTGYIPFIGNNKPKRALMATNMNRQAVHVFGAERPYVTTATDNMIDEGITRAKDIVARWAEARDIDMTAEQIANTIIVLTDITKAKIVDGGLRTLVFTAKSALLPGRYTIDIPYYLASSSGCYYYFNVNSEQTEFIGDDIVYHHRDILSDDLTTFNEPNFGKLVDISTEKIDSCGYALGRNLKVLFKSFKGYTYEDAVVINRDLFEDKSLTSIFLTEVKCELQDVPNLSTVESFGISGLTLATEERTYMQDNGLPAIGSYIRGGQMVIGRVRREIETLGNDKIENASIHLDSKSEGWVVDARIIRSEVGNNKGKSDMAVVTIASVNDISLGDKMVGRHGNKGVIALIVPREDMPFCEDGEIPDVILNPLGVIARGNVGQLLEIVVGMAGYKMNRRIVIPDLSPENYKTVMECQRILEEDYGFKEQTVYDGETGLAYPKKMLLGVMHMYKLVHTAKKPSKVIGAANNAVNEISQQPKNGQRVSELQVNCYIAHGATETLDSLFSLQSDDIRGAESIQVRTQRFGCSTENGSDAVGDNKSDEIVRAYLRALGVDLMSVADGVAFKYLTDDDILEISGYGRDNVVSISAEDADNAVLALHSEVIFGAESKKDSRTIKNRINRRNTYGRIELGHSVIMPIIFRNSAFLKRFQFLKWSFSEAKYNVSDDDDGSEEITYLKCTVSRDSISDSVVSALITGGYTSLAYCSNSLSFVDTKEIDNLSADCQREAIEVLKKLDFNTDVLCDKEKKNKFYSPHKIGHLAEMYRAYDTETLALAAGFATDAYNEYENYLGVEIDFDGSYNNKTDFVYRSRAVIGDCDKPVGIRGSEYFVNNMLIMPASYRPRYTTTRGERVNDIDATYIKILKRSYDVKVSKNKQFDYSFEVAMLYQALDSCYKKPKGSKSTTSIADYLLSSNIDKRSTIIRGFVGAKRVSYSCRSVIAVNPNLQLMQCGIPYKHALTLWEENLIYRLQDRQLIEGKTALTAGNIHNLIKYLIDDNYFAIGADLFNITNNPVEIAKKIEDCVIEELVSIMKDEVVVLNREPALHKFNNLAFIPVLCDGLAIQLHPLVCTAYNADFDGDTMYAVVIKSETGKSEARKKMMTSNNIINPKDGKNILALKQDIVLGIYMLTMLKGNSPDEVSQTKREPVSFYRDITTLEQDVEVGFISIYDYVDFVVKSKKDNTDKHYISTAGRILFNNLLPESSGFTDTEIRKGCRVFALKYDYRINGKQLNGIITDCFEKYSNNEVTIKLLDRIKEYGMRYADKSGATISINDFQDKSHLVEEDIARVKSIVGKYDLYAKLKLFPAEDKRKAVVDLWSSELKMIQAKIGDAMDIDGSVYAIIDSGARGEKSDFNAISGVIGQVRNVDDSVIERPILGNYLKGLTADEYFISTYTARRGQISTSTKTADSGKNNRDISHMLNNVKVVNEDCGASSYHFRLKYGKIKENAKARLIGKTITSCKYEIYNGAILIDKIPADVDESKYLTFDDLELTQIIELGLDGVNTKIPRELNVIHKSLLDGRVVEEEDNPWLPKTLLSYVEYANSDVRGSEYVINSKTLEWIEDNPHEYIDVRLLIGCDADGGICSKCHGKDIETKKLIEVGKYIGLISAMAISEVATQGTMNVHHAKASDSGLGGVASRFQNALNAKQIVKVSSKYNRTTDATEYAVSIRKGSNDSFVKVADDLTEVGAIREQGLALLDGIVEITNRVTADGKTIVKVSDNDTSQEYNIYKNELIVKNGEEVRMYQPLTCYYDYNQIMELDQKFAREFYVMDFAGIFYGSGNPIRAIHFELIGREQTNYVRVTYSVDGCSFVEAFPRSMSSSDIDAELTRRYPSTAVSVNKIENAVLGKSRVMDSRDIIANAFSDSMFSKVGKYCMNGKVDNCSAPLTNVYVGKKIRGVDEKTFKIKNLQYETDRTKPKKQNNQVEELDTSGDSTEYGSYDTTVAEMQEIPDYDSGEVYLNTEDALYGINEGGFNIGVGVVEYDSGDGVNIDGDESSDLMDIIDSIKI